MRLLMHAEEADTNEDGQVDLAELHAYFKKLRGAVDDGRMWTDMRNKRKLDKRGRLDLKNFIDVDAEIDRNEKLLAKLQGQIQGKQKKLANENLVARAPEDVVQRERDGLIKLEKEVVSVEKALQAFRSQ